MSGLKVLSLNSEFDKLVFVGDRKPDSSSEAISKAFSELSDYRDGAIFLAHYAGNSSWEQHPSGDEIVTVVSGETTLFLLGADGEQAKSLKGGDIAIVPENVWHRFETPHGVKLLSITPQPTNHSIDRPNI